MEPAIYPDEYDFAAASSSPTSEVHTYVFGFYELDREYGGPEEGGWWYDSGTLVRPWMVKRCTTQRMYEICSRANALLQHLQRNKRSTGSVLYSGGRHSVSAFENRLPECWPEQRPHYE